MSTPVEQAAVERVARAICDQRWGEDGQVHQPTGWDRETARAVIEALQLTDEWGVITDMGHVPLKPMTEDHARKLAAKYDDMTARRRLVGPWRTAQ